MILELTGQAGGSPKDGEEGEDFFDVSARYEGAWWHGKRTGYGVQCLEHEQYKGDVDKVLGLRSRLRVGDER